MEVFRIIRDIYADKLIGSGRANRWNYDDQFVLYTGSSRALSSLELIVHRNSIQPVFNYKVVVINIADENNLFTNVFERDLPRNWRNTISYPDLQSIGGKWYNTKQSLVLKVPSAVIPSEYNYLINTIHPDFSLKIAQMRTEDYFWDNRLL